MQYPHEHTYTCEFLRCKRCRTFVRRVRFGVPAVRIIIRQRAKTFPYLDVVYKLAGLARTAAGDATARILTPHHPQMSWCGARDRTSARDARDAQNESVSAVATAAATDTAAYRL